MLTLRICAAYLVLVVALQETRAVLENHYEPLFREFIQNHGKSYKTPSEHEFRFNVFKENMKKAVELQRRDQGTAVYGATKFSDLTVGEFQERYLRQPLTFGSDRNYLIKAKIPKIRLPKNFDWRKKNVVSPVQNMDQCATGWVFASVGNIESIWAIKHKKLYTLSKQELSDCANFNQSCWKPLTPQKAYQAVISLGGLETESGYPYSGKDDQTCSFNKTKVVVKISGAVNLSRHEDDMAKWLVKNGPIAIGINAVNLMSYQSGIAHPLLWDCLPGPSHIGHFMLIVGFGTQKHKGKKIPYWIIKNFWSLSWGEKGYYRIYRGGGLCGLNSMASSAVL